MSDIFMRGSPEAFFDGLKEYAKKKVETHGLKATAIVLFVSTGADVVRNRPKSAVVKAIGGAGVLMLDRKLKSERHVNTERK